MFMAYIPQREWHDTNNFVIIDGVKYKGIPGLYELIFKRILDDTIQRMIN